MKSIKKRWARPHIHKGRFYHDSCGTKPQGILIACVQLFSSLAREISILCVSFIRRLKTAAKTRNLHAIYKPKRKAFIPTHKSTPSSMAPRVTWIGHASLLIEYHSVTILTDPIFGQPSFLFPRITPPGIALAALPHIDYILISHNHWDHMHAKSLIALRDRFPQVTMLVPEGTGSWFTLHGFTNVIEHTWWQTTTIPEHAVQFTFTPARHWSQRSFFDRNCSLWGSWMIEHNDATIYFAGDTAYDTHFNAIAERFPFIDIALMPVGPCEPRRWMCHSHTSAEEAGNAFRILKATHFIPMHWGTFYFGIDNIMTPIERLNAWWKLNAKRLSGKQLHVLGIGQSFEPILFVDKIVRNAKQLTRHQKNIRG